MRTPPVEYIDYSMGVYNLITSSEEGSYHGKPRAEIVLLRLSRILRFAAGTA
jgi:hypothetical protein